MNKKEVEQEAIRKAKDQQAAAGKSSGMSGRDLFAYNPEWFEQEDGDDEGEGWDISQYRNVDTEEESVSAVAEDVADLRLDSVRDGIGDNP